MRNEFPGETVEDITGTVKWGRMKRSAIVLLLVICSFAAGCATPEVISKDTPAYTFDLKSDLFGERPPIVSITEVHTLAAAQRESFERFFNDPKNRRRPPHKRVYDYLELVSADFSYLGETYTASEALDHAGGNCLALAILTTALAQIAEVEIEYQLVDSEPVFESGGNHIRRSLHVRSMLYDPTWIPPENFLILSRPGIKIDYFPSDFDRFIGNIDESEYFAMYYRNVAADSIEEQDLGTAYWLLMEAFELSPTSPETLNMLAIVFDRAGDKARSEAIYRHGIKHAERRVSLLRNYSIFLKRQGRAAEAQGVSRMLSELDDPNPFDWIYAGHEAYGEGQYKRAIRLFNKSVELAPYLHEGYFGLAKAHYQLGNLERSQRELEQALVHATRSSTRTLYEAKLGALRQN